MFLGTVSLGGVHWLPGLICRAEDAGSCALLSIPPWEHLLLIFEPHSQLCFHFCCSPESVDAHLVIPSNDMAVEERVILQGHARVADVHLIGLSGPLLPYCLWVSGIPLFLMASTTWTWILLIDLDFNLDSLVLNLFCSLGPWSSSRSGIYIFPHPSKLLTSHNLQCFSWSRWFGMALRLWEWTLLLFPHHSLAMSSEVGVKGSKW